MKRGSVMEIQVTAGESHRRERCIIIQTEERTDAGSNKETDGDDREREVNSSSS